MRMRFFWSLMFVATTTAQLNFGPSSSSTSAPNAPGQDLKTRNNFLQDIFGTNQGGNNFNQGGNNFNQGPNNFNQGPNNFNQGISNSNQGGNNFNQGISNSNQGNSFCCCVPLNDQCGDPLGRYIEELDLVGDGLINPRLKPIEEEATKRTSQSSASIITRIVNKPNVAETAPLTTCPSGQKACCYDPSVDQSFLGRSCISPGSSQVGRFENVHYGCNERVVSSRKECGTRNFPAPSRNLQHGEASPGEFPWTCLILDGNNDFIGSCAIIPNDSSNNNGRGTRKVVTAAHKLKNVQQNEFLKIRVGEYDASGFSSPETFRHEEYTVRRILPHPQFNAGRLSNDIAIVYTDRDINVNQPNVNTACLPSCSNQFGHQFNNGTGTRCWVAGWGKNAIDGSFQMIQHKVDLPLVENNSCNNRLKSALNRQRAGSGNRFSLSQSEICAGGQVGKDACTGDGGSPLVCQGLSGRWTVVGLVTWGVGCASDVPGVYARMSHFTQWIDQN